MRNLMCRKATSRMRWLTFTVVLTLRPACFTTRFLGVAVLPQAEGWPARVFYHFRLLASIKPQWPKQQAIGYWRIRTGISERSLDRTTNFFTAPITAVRRWHN